MALLAGHWTKLNAVNQILASIGEDPVNSLDSGLPEAEAAENFLDDSNRVIQLKGWHVNTRQDIELTQNSSDQFVLPANTLKVTLVNPRGPRKASTPAPSSYINAVMRRSADDTTWLLYDLDNDSETWTNGGVTKVTVDLVQHLDFANLTPALQRYIFTHAARAFQQSVMGSAALNAFTENDVLRAEIDAVNEDLENEHSNVIRDSTSVYDIVYRYNPRFGR